jgi:hypothetical protein
LVQVVFFERVGLNLDGVGYKGEGESQDGNKATIVALGIGLDVLVFELEVFQTGVLLLKLLKGFLEELCFRFLVGVDMEKVIDAVCD